MMGQRDNDSASDITYYVNFEAAKKRCGFARFSMEVRGGPLRPLARIYYVPPPRISPNLAESFLAIPLSGKYNLRMTDSYRIWRKTMGVRLWEVASFLGVSEACVQRWEGG